MGSLGWVGVDDAAFADGPADFALHGPAVEGCVFGLRFRVGGSVDPFGFGIEDDYVCIAANGESTAAFEAQEGCGLRAEQADDAAEGHLPLFVKPAERETERRLETGDAVGSVLELHFLFVRGVGRVIGGDGVND